MKACVVSMKYDIKNSDGTPTLNKLDECYDDGEKVIELLKNTLKWDTEDVSKFKDSSVYIKNLYGKID
jgi:bacterioferritin (cytochrome b1)